MTIRSRLHRLENRAAARAVVAAKRDPDSHASVVQDILLERIGPDELALGADLTDADRVRSAEEVRFLMQFTGAAADLSADLGEEDDCGKAEYDAHLQRCLMALERPSRSEGAMS